MSLIEADKLRLRMESLAREHDLIVEQIAVKRERIEAIAAEIWKLAQEERKIYKTLLQEMNDDRTND